MIQEINKIFNADILAKSRKQNNVFAKIAYAKIMRLKGKKLQAIGNEIGKTHDTIIYYCIQHDQLYKFDRDYKIMFNQLNQN